jgi:hypothetical protein
MLRVFTTHREKTCWIAPFAGIMPKTLFALSQLLIFFGAVNANAAQATFAWDAVSSPIVAGYRIYYGQTSRNYAIHADVGNATNATILGLQDGVMYYFAVTAYDGYGNESAYSNEVSYQPPVTASTNQGGVTGSSNTTTTSSPQTSAAASDIQGSETASSNGISYPQPSDYFNIVEKIYIGYYGRPADPEGLIYWGTILNATGGDLTEVVEAFANSYESQMLHGTIDSSHISEVVNSIYRALFGRDAEAGGLNWYVNGFNSGKYTAATIMLNILNGAQNEDLQSVNNKVVAAGLFTKIIDPDFGGYNIQATYAGEGDAIAGRDFLSSVTWDPGTVPTQDQITGYIKAHIADTGDPIL